MSSLDLSRAAGTGAMLSRFLRPQAMLAMFLVVAVLALLPSFNLVLDVPADTIWLLHAGERLLAGDTLYVDVIETNPPMSVLLYLPAVWFGGVTGMGSANAALLQTALTGAFSLWLCATVLMRGVAVPAVPAPLLGVAALLYFFAANASLTQREHYALMLLLPYLFLQARLQGGGGFPPAGVRIGIALLAGLAVCIKPHFLLAPVMMAGTTAFVRRDWRLLFTLETFIGLAVFAAYVAAALSAFPQFFGSVWPLLSEVYLPATKSLPQLLYGNPPTRLWVVLCLFCAAIAWLWAGRSVILIWMPAFVAFSIVFLTQGKGFIYHIYPAAAVGTLFAAHVALTDRGADAGRRLALALSAAVFFFATGHSQSEPFRAPGLVAALGKHPPGAKLITVSEGMEVTIAVLGRTELTWASRLHIRWLTYEAERLIRHAPNDAAHIARMEHFIGLDRQILREDIAKLPDVIVFDHYERDWEAWTRQDAATARIIDAHYRRSIVTDGGMYSVYSRTSPAPSASSPPK